ncbi:MAG TPA: hypothetical protein PKN33_16215 [Phycisphaerae bacterium]|nr:hypothetical protein [Phycisphaerae bacterium]
MVLARPAWGTKQASTGFEYTRMIFTGIGVGLSAMAGVNGIYQFRSGAFSLQRAFLGYTCFGATDDHRPVIVENVVTT